MSRNSKFLLRLHQYKAHKQYDCEHCELKFKTSSDLKSHKCQSASKSIDGGPIIDGAVTHSKSELCEVCGKSFKDPKGHVANRHCHQKEHSCPQCHYTHASVAGIKRHVRNCHGTKPHNSTSPRRSAPYMCNLCDKTFATKFTAEHHLKGVKIIFCGCNKD